MKEQNQNDQTSQENQRRIGIADRTVIIVTCIAVGVATSALPGIFTPADIFIGLALIVTLHASDNGEDWSWYQTVSFAVGWAIASILVVGIFLINPYILQENLKPYDDPFRGTWLEIPAWPVLLKNLKGQAADVVSSVWAVAIALLAFVVRARRVQIHYSLPHVLTNKICCTNCHAILPSYAKFCGICGANLKRVSKHPQHEDAAKKSVRLLSRLFRQKAVLAKADTQSSASAKEEQASKADPSQVQKKT